VRIAVQSSAAHCCDVRAAFLNMEKYDVDDEDPYFERVAIRLSLESDLDKTGPIPEEALQQPARLRAPPAARM
jgi:hypothetical protein